MGVGPLQEVAAENGPVIGFNPLQTVNPSDALPNCAVYLSSQSPNTRAEV